MSEVILPDGWVETEWNNITTLDGFRRGPFGGNLKKAFFVKEGYAIYEQYAPINNDCIKFRYFITEEKYQELSSFWVEQEDFLISCSGTMGRITQVPEGSPKGVINQALLRIRLNNTIINPNFFLKLFRSPITQEKILTKSVGGAIQNLAAVNELKKIKLPIPPLAEQKVIADLLDQLIAQVDKLKLRLETILTTLKQFRQSVLNAAVTGKLTADWRKLNPCSSINIKELEQYWSNNYKSKQKKYTHFKSNKYSILKDIHLPDSWVKTQVGEVFDVHVGATPSRSDDSYWNGNINWVSSAEVAFCRISSTKEKITQKGLSSCSTKVHPIGTVMLAMIGQGKTRGQAAVLDTPACHNQNTAALRIAKKYTLPEFLYYYLMSQYQITRMVGSGNNQKALNKISVQELPFPLPPFKEQQEIVNRVESYFAFADKIEQQVKSAQERANNLTPALLAKAFKGELTADWRAKHPELISGENSAEALLKRIQAEQAALTKPAKAKKVKK